MKPFAIVLVLVLAAAVAAAPIGRPVTAEHQWVLGAVGSYERTKVEGRRTIEFGDFKSHLWMAEAAYGFVQGAEAVMRIGVSNDRYTNISRPLSFSSRFDWGVGIRGAMYESWRDWRINGDLQYIARPERSYLNTDIDIKEWQGAVSVEHDLREFHPYYGLNYNRTSIRSNNPTLVPELIGSKNIGVQVGAGFSRSEDWSFLVEARFLNTTAFSAGATFHF